MCIYVYVDVLIYIVLEVRNSFIPTFQQILRSVLLIRNFHSGPLKSKNEAAEHTTLVGHFAKKESPTQSYFFAEPPPQREISSFCFF